MDSQFTLDTCPELAEGQIRRMAHFGQPLVALVIVHYVYPELSRRAHNYTLEWEVHEADFVSKLRLLGIASPSARNHIKLRDLGDHP